MSSPFTMVLILHILPLAHGNVIVEGQDIRVITVREPGRARSAPFVPLPPGVRGGGCGGG